MKLLIYTNLESYYHEGLIQNAESSYQELELHCIKGISFGAEVRNISNQQEADQYDILLCHQSITAEEVLPFIDLEHDWAIALHATDGKKLRNLYTRLARLSTKKVLYRYEYSAWGSTIDLVRKITTNHSGGFDFAPILSDYYQRFEEDAILTFKQDLVQSRNLLMAEKVIADWKSSETLPYLWKNLFESHIGIAQLIEKYAANSNEEERKKTYLQIRKLLKTTTSHSQQE